MGSASYAGVDYCFSYPQPTLNLLSPFFPVHPQRERLRNIERICFLLRKVRGVPQVDRGRVIEKGSQVNSRKEGKVGADLSSLEPFRGKRS